MNHDLRPISSNAADAFNASKPGGVERALFWATHHPLGFKGLLWVLALGVSAALAWGLPGVFKSFDERSDYWTWNLKSSGSPERRLVVVDIDEKSVQAVGAWPWSRETMADLVLALNQEGAGLKIFDVVFPDAKTGDASLQTALAQGAPNVGGQIFSINPEVAVRSGALSKVSSLSSLSGPCSAAAQTGYGFMGNAPELASAFTQVGHLTPSIDPDGAVRQVPALVCFEGINYPALSLTAFMALGGSSTGQAGSTTTIPTTSATPYLQLVKGESWREAPWSLALTHTHPIPLNAQGQIRVSYRTPRSDFVSLSASDVLAHRVPQDLLKGAWVLVGSTAFGAGDAIPTPHGGAEGGLEVHAQLITAALDNATPYTPMGSLGLQALVVGIFSALLLMLSVFPSKALSPSRSQSASAQDGQEDKAPSSALEALQNVMGLSAWHLRERWVFALPVLGLAFMGACFGLHAWSLLSLNWWLGWSVPAFMVASCAVAFTVGDLAVLRWQRTRLFENLARYVSTPVANEVALSPPSDQVDAHAERVVVMALNVRNFDRYCDTVGPESSAAFLHGYLSLLSQQVASSGGELHHVQGSEALAVWRLGKAQSQAQAKAQGETQTQAMEKQTATHAALALGRGLWESSQAWQGIPAQAELELEMGLEAGEAWVGSMGPGERRFHAVIGEPVVLAQALRGMAAELAYPVLLGPQVADVLASRSPTPPKVGHSSVEELPLLRLGEFLLPGTAEPRVVFASPVSIEDQRLRLVSGSLAEQRVA